MNGFRGARRRKNYFEGYYVKHQTDNLTLALIPAIHIDSSGNKTASLQIATDTQSEYIPFSASDFTASPEQFSLRLGQNLFQESGISLNIHTSQLSLEGALRYNPFTPLPSDIMGPFRFFPMQCSHGVLSLCHGLQGTLMLNGKAVDFSGGTGYIETDRGNGFPSRYLWTQCAWQQQGDCCVMASAADIPFGGQHFDGCIVHILYGGKHYRFATYRGVRIHYYNATGMQIEQGRYRLNIHLLKQNPFTLKAPVAGQMLRQIEESPVATVRYQLYEGDRLLFDHTDERASFEWGL